MMEADVSDLNIAIKHGKLNVLMFLISVIGLNFEWLD